MVFLSQNGISVLAQDVIITLFIVLLTLFTFAALVVALCKFSGTESKKAGRKAFVAVVLAAGAALRLVFALCVRGYREDYRLFASMIEHLETSGLTGYYKGEPTETLYPIVYFVYLIFGGLGNLTGLTDYELGMQLTVKLPLILCDLAAAYAVYKIAKRYFDKTTADILLAFVCACPVFFIGSCLWATPIVFTATFACFACYFLARKNYAAAIGFATAAAFSGKEGIFLFPVFAVFSVFHIVKAAINIKRDKPSFKEIFSADYSAVVAVPVGFILSVAAAYLLGLFMFASYSYNIFKFIYEFTLAPLVSKTYFTYNGLSVYTLFGMNGDAMGARFPTWLIFALFSAIIVAVVCVVYFSKRNRATLVMLAAYSLFTVQIYFTGTSAVTIYCALPLLTASYALVKDKRLLYVLFVAGSCYAVNACSTLAVSGYLNNFSDYVFESAGSDVTTLMTGGYSAITIVCSALSVLCHIYFTVIMANIGMTGQKKLLGKADGIGESFKRFFSIRNEDVS